jgi:hypothetical protein
MPVTRFSIQRDELAGQYSQGTEPEQQGDKPPDRTTIPVFKKITDRIESVIFSHPPHLRAYRKTQDQTADPGGTDPPPCG